MWTMVDKAVFDGLAGLFDLVVDGQVKRWMEVRDRTAGN